MVQKYSLSNMETMSYQVGQEDSLMKCLIKRSTLPRIAMYAFVYHFKSVTVKVS